MHGIVLRLKLTHIYLLCAWLFSVLFFVFFVFVSSLSFLFLSICLHWWRLRPLLRNTQHSTITYTTANASSQKKVLILSRNVYISFWNSKCVSIFSVCFFFFKCRSFVFYSWRLCHSLLFSSSSIWIAFNIRCWLFGKSFYGIHVRFIVWALCKNPLRFILQLVFHFVVHKHIHSHSHSRAHTLQFNALLLAWSNLVLKHIFSYNMQTMF